MDRPTPPYRQIAENLRARISAGDLGPGDPIPSARRLRQEWGVALATATRALGVLAADGLTAVIPGVGTVVAHTGGTRTASAGAARPTPDRPATRAADGELSLDRVTRTAVRIADAEGLAQATMRRLATELGVATMSLYRHVGSKDDLVIHMIEAVLEEDPLPARPPEGWRARLELSSRVQWRGFRRHPWLAPALSITRPQLIRSGLRHTEWALAALDGLGLTPQQRLHVHLTVFSHVRGLALNLESEAEAERDSGLTSDEWMQTQAGDLYAMTAGGEFPHAASLFSVDVDLDLDGLFEYGLARLLDGLAVQFNRPQ